MVTQKECDRVLGYLKNYCSNDSDTQFINELDNFIVECSLTPVSLLQADILLDKANTVKSKMDEFYTIDTGCSPRLLEYQERYFQLMILYSKAAGIDDTAPLSMLCFTSSFDLFWLQCQKQV